MNTIRIIAIALPMAFLLACGGGGGGSATAPTTPNLATLPSYAVTNLDTARDAVGGDAPTGNMNEVDIVSAIQSRATAADTFEFSNFSPAQSFVEVTCPSNSSCSGTVPDVGTLTFSLTDIEDLSLVDDTGLVGFDSNTQAVMVDRNVTVIQSRSAGRQSDGTQLTFQTYGGWLADSVFGVQFFHVTESGTTTDRFATFSFGDASGSNPTGAGETHWDGVMVGAEIGTGDLVQGDARFTINLSQTSNDGMIGFSNIKNLNTGADIADIQPHIFGFTNGSFALASGRLAMEGAFYGDNQEEIGGVFSSANLHGAFGARRQ